MQCRARSSIFGTLHEADTSTIYLYSPVSTLLASTCPPTFKEIHDSISPSLHLSSLTYCKRREAATQATRTVINNAQPAQIVRLHLEHNNKTTWRLCFAIITMRPINRAVLEALNSLNLVSDPSQRQTDPNDNDQLILFVPASLMPPGGVSNELALGILELAQELRRHGLPLDSIWARDGVLARRLVGDRLRVGVVAAVLGVIRDEQMRKKKKAGEKDGNSAGERREDEEVVDQEIKAAVGGQSQPGLDRAEKEIAVAIVIMGLLLVAGFGFGNPSAYSE